MHGGRMEVAYFRIRVIGSGKGGAGRIGTSPATRHPVGTFGRSARWGPALHLLARSTAMLVPTQCPGDPIACHMR